MKKTFLKNLCLLTSFAFVLASLALCCNACSYDKHTTNTSNPEEIISEKYDKDNWHTSMSLWNGYAYPNFSMTIKVAQDGNWSKNYEIFYKITQTAENTSSIYQQFTRLYDDNGVKYPNPTIEKIYQYQYPYEWDRGNSQYTICSYSIETESWSKKTQEHGVSIYSEGLILLNDIATNKNSYDKFEYDDTIKGYVSTEYYKNIFRVLSGKIVVKFKNNNLVFLQILPDDEKNYSETINIFDIGTTVVEDIRNEIS